MRIVMFGATGMIGQGVLRECLLDRDVEHVLAVGRRPTGLGNDKLRELAHRDFTDLTPLERGLAGFDACFFCLGVSSAGMSEDAYTRVTFDLTMAAARALARSSPGMTFIYVSGAGTDSTESGRMMWPRVKGRTENALLKLPFRAKYMFRPAFVQPMHGIVSRTRLCRILYAVVGPRFPVFRVLFPAWLTTTESVGKAMLRGAKQGAPRAVLENADINALAQEGR